MAVRVVSVGLWVCLWVFPGPALAAANLAQRLAQFPDWQAQPALPRAVGDLTYPDWFVGDWQVTSTLTELRAPLAPLTTPGFEQNRQWLDRPVSFPVRFVATTGGAVVADRAFNGLSLARAYLGAEAVRSVKIDPNSVNRQVTLLSSGCPDALRCSRQLVSLITNRSSETPGPQTYITSELYQQQFRGQAKLYFNQVENTTAYHLEDSPPGKLIADQTTAVYLSPQDPDYFKAGKRPVGLYRYRLEFSKKTP